jgi:hypothetical protein
MNRRSFIQVVGVAAAGAIMPKGMAGQALDSAGRSFDTTSISVRLTQEQPGTTSVYLTEYGEADQVVIEAFYWASYQNQRILLHKEATAPLVKGGTVGASLLMPLDIIVFIRVKEMKLLGQSEFGKVPGRADGTM